MEPEEGLLPHSQVPVWTFRNMIRFYGGKLLAPHPTPKLEDHPVSAVHDCLFKIFSATLHIGRRSSIRNLRTRHDLVTMTHLQRLHKIIRNVFINSLLCKPRNLLSNLSKEFQQYAPHA